MPVLIKPLTRTSADVLYIPKYNWESAASEALARTDIWVGSTISCLQRFYTVAPDVANAYFAYTLQGITSKIGAGDQVLLYADFIGDAICTQDLWCANFTASKSGDYKATALELDVKNLYADEDAWTPTKPSAALTIGSGSTKSPYCGWIISANYPTYQYFRQGGIIEGFDTVGLRISPPISNPSACIYINPYDDLNPTSPMFLLTDSAQVKQTFNLMKDGRIQILDLGTGGKVLRISNLSRTATLVMFHLYNVDDALDLLGIQNDASVWVYNYIRATVPVASDIFFAGFFEGDVDRRVEIAHDYIAFGDGTNLVDWTMTHTADNTLVVNSGDSLSHNGNKGINVAVTALATSINITLTNPEPDASYGILVTPQWNTTFWITNKAVGGFTINFGTAPSVNSALDWWLFR